MKINERSLEMDRVLKDEWIKDDGSFNPQGSYTISNCMGYMVELNESGDGARLGIMQDDRTYKVTDWLDIEYVENYEAEDEDDAFEPIIDPQGFDVPLNLVMRI